MKIYKCDILNCGKIVDKENLFSLIIYRKGVSRKAGTKSDNSKDICKSCFVRLFDDTK